jgi:DNA-binding GntR family transcriptional regulator
MSVAERFLAPPKTISETIYQHVKAAIIAGELKPGQRIQEKYFSSLFRVSATPVREAFFRLAAEKFLVISARKEVLVQGASLEEVRELYEVVRALDKYALKGLAGRLSVRDRETLRTMTAKLSDHYARDDHRNYLDQNLRIHDWLWRTNGNRALHETLSQLMEKIAIYRKHSGFTPFADRGALEKSHSDHVRIMKALIEGDVDALETILALHWGEEFIEPRRGEPPLPPAGANQTRIPKDRRR